MGPYLSALQAPGTAVGIVTGFGRKHSGCPDQRIEASSEAAEKAFEQNVERAQGAMDTYFGFLQNVCGPDLTEKMITYTEQNISASTDCMHKLSRAKDFQEVFRIQTEFMQRQMNSFAEQARSLGEAYTKAATNATRRFASPLE